MKRFEASGNPNLASWSAGHFQAVLNVPENLAFGTPVFLALTLRRFSIAIYAA